MSTIFSHVAYESSQFVPVNKILLPINLFSGFWFEEDEEDVKPDELKERENLCLYVQIVKIWCQLISFLCWVSSKLLIWRGRGGCNRMSLKREEASSTLSFFHSSLLSASRRSYQILLSLIISTAERCSYQTSIQWSGWKWMKVDQSWWKYPRCYIYMHLWCCFLR